MNASCANCGGVAGEGVSLKTCKACMLVKYCNAKCQKNHWSKHKKICKERSAEIHDEALFKDPPAKDDCPICFLPMPIKLISCVSLPSATITSVPIYDFAGANAELANETMEAYYPCCGKSVCKACIHSFHYSGNDKCPFCNSDRGGKTVEDAIKDIRKRVESNDAASIYVLGSYYEHGGCGLQQDRTKSIELYARAADLGSSTANYNLAHIYHEGGDLKKAKFHREAAAMAGHEMARFDLGIIELKSSNMERAMKHCTISASNGSYRAMHALRTFFEQGLVSRESIDSTLATYNNSCAEMRCEARDV